MEQNTALILTCLATGFAVLGLVGVAVFQWFSIKDWKDALFISMVTFTMGIAVQDVLLGPLEGTAENVLTAEATKRMGTGLISLFAVVMFLPWIRILLIAGEKRVKSWERAALYVGAGCLLLLVGYLGQHGPGHF